MNPTSVMLSSGGTGSSTLTVTVPATAAPGTSSIFVEASGGCSLFHDAIISITITGPDFTIAAEKTQITIAQGGSDTAKIDLASKDGFSGAITLSASTFPLMTTLTPPTVTLTAGGTGTSTLTVQAPSTVEPNNYTVIVDASSGFTLFHSVDIFVTVTGPTFALSASPEFLTVEAGGSNSSTITVTPLGAFSGTVSLSITSTYPPGLTTALDKMSITVPPASSVTLTVTSTSGTKPGYYYVGIAGISGPHSKSATVFVRVKGPDFGISADPFFVTILAGSYCTSTISLASIDSFTSSVSLTKMASPGLTAMLSSASVTVPGSSTLTISAPTTMVPGFYTVLVNGTSISPARTHTETVEVEVIGPDFSLSASPSPLTVTDGQFNTSSISLTGENGFSATVVLVATSFDPGITVNVKPSTISGSQTATLNVTVATGTLPGDFYTVQVTGTSGLLSHTIYIPLTVKGPDFSLSANPSSLTLAAGTSKSSQITISPILGFTDSVDLFAAPSSADLNASILPTTVTGGSGTATLSVNSTIPGTYSVDVSGSTLSGLFHDITVPVIVQGPNFSLSSNPSSLTITASTSQTSTISINSMNGFSGVVGLTASGPSGFSENLSPSSILPSQTSTLTVSLVSAVTPGSYTVTVTGSSGSKLTHSLDIPVTVNTRSSATKIKCDSSVVEGSSATCTVTVTDTSPSNFITPVGSFMLTSNSTGTFSGPCNLSGNTASATCTVNYTPNVAGGHKISADFPGDTFHSASSDSTVISTTPLPKHDTSTLVVCAPSPVVVNQVSTCTATVTDTSPTPTTPSGKVMFTLTGAGSLSTSSCTLNYGYCTVTFTSSTTGTGTIVGTYGGDPTHNTSVSPSVGLTVNTRSTGTTVSCKTPVSVNAPSLCTVTVTDSSTVGSVVTPTSTVSVTSDIGTLSGPSCVLAQSVAGSSTCNVTFSSSSPGQAKVTANYGGDSVHSGSSNTASITVTGVSKHDTATTLACATPVVVGEASTCAATVSDTSASGKTTPTGTVSFTSTGAGSLSTPASCTLVSGSCSITFTPSAAGAATVTASYGGDSSHNASTSASYSISVPGPDFSINSNPTSLIITQGSSSTSSINLSAQNGFTGAVALTVSSTTGITVTFTPTTIYPPGSSYTTQISTMTVTVDSSVAAGSYTITVTGTSGSLTHHLSVPLTVNTSPSPVSPAPTIFGLAPVVFYGIVGGVVAVVAVGAGATIFLRRRKP